VTLPAKKMLALIVKGNQAGMLDKGSNGSTEAHALRAAPTATLSHRAVTHEAQALVSAVYDTITANELARGTRKKARQTNAHIFRRAVEGFLGDLLLALAREETKWVKHSLKTDDFTAGPVGYRHFRDLVEGLKHAGLVESKPAVAYRISDWGDGNVTAANWFITRYRASRDLLAMAEGHGVRAADIRKHFLKVPDEPLKLRAGSRYYDKFGNKLPSELINWRTKLSKELALKGHELEREVQELNDFLSKFTLAGCVHGGYVRLFNNGDASNFAWNKGGRLYSDFQQMKEEERARITINDEAVCEVDVSASNLTIFLGLKGVQIDLQRDPYDLGAGLPRDVVKHWVTSSFRKGRLCGEWPKAYREDLGGFSPALIGNKVLAAYPALESLSAEGTEDLWAELMYAESDAMVQASTRLMQHSVPSLAVHDGMIVPVSQRELAERTIRSCYYGVCQAEPKLKTTIFDHDTNTLRVI
jgi:hypothetical protein